MDFYPVATHQESSALSTALVLTPPFPEISKIRIQAATQNVRYRLDGRNPTATSGFLIIAGAAPVVIDVPAGMSIALIQVAASASIQYQWGV